MQRGKDSDMRISMAIRFFSAVSLTMFSVCLTTASGSSSSSSISILPASILAKSKILLLKANK